VPCLRFVVQLFNKCGTYDQKCFFIISTSDHSIIIRDNFHRWHTFARIGTQSACSSVTLNQMPRKLFSVHCFSDAGKSNTYLFQFQFLEDRNVYSQKSFTAQIMSLHMSIITILQRKCNTYHRHHCHHRQRCLHHQKPYLKIQSELNISTWNNDTSAEDTDGKLS
jgi:hypothetical protein